MNVIACLPCAILPQALLQSCGGNALQLLLSDTLTTSPGAVVVHRLILPHAQTILSAVHHFE